MCTRVRVYVCTRARVCVCVLPFLLQVDWLCMPFFKSGNYFENKIIRMKIIMFACLVLFHQCYFLGRPKAKAGEEPTQLGFLRSKLLNFLHSSLYYEPEGLISKFPIDSEWAKAASSCYYMSWIASNIIIIIITSTATHSRCHFHLCVTKWLEFWQVWSMSLIQSLSPLL